MGRLFGWIAMLVALYTALSIYTKGVEGTFGDAFAPIASGDDREAPLASHLTAGAQLADPPSERRRRVPVTEAVRERVTADLAEGARRRGY